MYRTLTFWTMLTMIAVCANGQPLETVGQVDLLKYTGRWYEIASYPARFQKGCRCTTAEYELLPGNNYLGVINRCIRIRNGKLKISTVRGKAFIVKGSGNAKLKVQFFWPFRGDYYIIALSDDYSWAVVGHPDRKYLWILSRESYMPTDIYNHILTLVKDRGYDVRILQKTPQNCDLGQ